MRAVRSVVAVFAAFSLGSMLPVLAPVQLAHATTDPCLSPQPDGLPALPNPQWCWGEPETDYIPNSAECVEVLVWPALNPARNPVPGHTEIIDTTANPELCDFPTSSDSPSPSGPSGPPSPSGSPPPAFPCTPGNPNFAGCLPAPAGGD